jgi:hypothetical protein
MFIGLNYLTGKILFVLPVTNCGLFDISVSYLIPTVAIGYLKMYSIIGFDQLVGTSSTLSRSIDPIPQLWSSDTNYGLLISAMVSYVILLPSGFILQEHHYESSIESDFPCIPSSIMIMVLLLLLYNHQISYLHASHVLKYSSVEAKHDFCLVLPSKFCGCFPQLYFFFMMQLHLVFRIFQNSLLPHTFTITL